MKNERYLPYLFPLLAAMLLVVFEANLLWQLQEQNLFMHTPLFFQQRMVVPGGLLEWAGCYLTQFFCYPLLGAGLLCLLWALLIWLLTLTFQSPLTAQRQRAGASAGIHSPLVLLPVACLLLTIVDLGYWVFYLKLPGHAFDATIGSIVAICLAWVYTKLYAKNRWAGPIFIIIATAFGYPLFGFYALWATLLMGVLSWHRKDRRLVAIFISLLSIVAVPLVYYCYVFHETNIVNIYWAALPVFRLRQKTYFAYNLPYIFLVASTLFMAAFQFHVKRRRIWLQVVALISIAVCVAVFWYKDDNFHRELSMSRSIEGQQWKEVLQTAQSVKGEPTRAVCMMKNLALFRLGRQGDEMFTYANGAKRPNAPFPLRMVQTYGKMLYYQYGIPNYCYRWCMEDGVEYGWSVRILKLMARCSLLNGEPVAAQRFLSMLKKTDFHGDWARKYEPFVHQPQLLGQDQEMAPILHLLRQDDFLTADLTQMELFLLEHFTTAQSNDPLLQEQILIASMQTKNIQLFWKALVDYTKLHPNGRVPRHYQEAACLFGHLQNFDISHIPFDATVEKDYQEFANIVGTYRRQGKGINDIRPLVHDRFCHTYYYDFYFNQYNYIEQ